MTVTNTFDYLFANDLPEKKMIAGDETTIYYYVYDSASALQDIRSTTCYVNIFRYGDPTDVVLTLDGVISASPTVGEFIVTIPSASSIDMSGVYAQQPVVVDYTGEKHIPSQGKLIVLPNPDA